MPFTYTIRITNTGDLILDPLVLTDTLPNGFNYIAGSGNPADPDTIAEPTLVWQDLGALDLGDSIAVSFVVTVTPGILGSHENVATAAGTSPSGIVTGTSSAWVTLADPSIAIDKQLAPNQNDSGYVTFTIFITNTGPTAITTLPLVDEYSIFLQYERATPVPDNAPPAEGFMGGGTLVWDDLTAAAPNGFGQNLLPGQVFILTTVFRLYDTDITATMTNTAVITGSAAGGPVDLYNNGTNRPIDMVNIWISGSGIPTPVELDYFRAQAEGQAIRLEWATAMEVDSVGFYVYRASDDDPAHAQAIAFTPATGDGSLYQYLDRDVTPGQTYWYWLAEVSTDGAETLYGPVQASVGVSALQQPYRLYMPLVFHKAGGE
jgi:hypothetical protein